MITATEAARKLGIAPRTAQRLCAENSIGVLLTPRARMLTEADVDLLAAASRGAVGNPQFRDPATAASVGRDGGKASAKARTKRSAKTKSP